MQRTAKIEHPILQRARGEIDLAVAAGKIKRFYQSGSAKIFMPKTYAATLEAVLVNTAGGLAGGDSFEVALAADGATDLTVSTQTAERVYRSLGPKPAQTKFKMTLTGPARLHWLPQETILFDGAGFSRYLNVSMEKNASFFASEMMVFGRTAMKETLRHGNVLDQWRVWRDGELIHAEALRLEGEIFKKLNQPASIDGCICLATTLYVGDDAERKTTPARAFFQDYTDVRTAVSAWDKKLVIRSISSNTAQLKQSLARFVEQFREIPNPRVWCQ